MKVRVGDILDDPRQWFETDGDVVVEIVTVHGKVYRIEQSTEDPEAITVRCVGTARSLQIESSGPNVLAVRARTSREPSFL